DEAADAFLALPGGLGTLEELLEIWVSRTLGMHTKPVVVLDPSGVFSALHDLVGALHRGGFVRASSAAAVTWATDVPEALDALQAGPPPPPPPPPPAARAREPGRGRRRRAPPPPRTDGAER